MSRCVVAGSLHIDLVAVAVGWRQNRIGARATVPGGSSSVDRDSSFLAGSREDSVLNPRPSRFT